MEDLKYNNDDDRLHVELARQIHLEMAGLVNCPKGWKGQSHSHPFWEFVFINSGEGEMKFGNQASPMKRDELFLIPPLQPHQFVNTGRDKVENLYVGFAFDIPSLPPLQGPLRLGPLDEALIGNLRSLTKTFKSAQEGSGFKKQSLMFDIIYSLLDLIQKDPELSRHFTVDKNEIIADKARKFLESNVHRTISVEEVAERFFLSPHYFSRKFKSETGLGIKAYHNRVRMEKALELLRDPLLSVSEVANRLGFNNVNYFTNKFREHYSQPPTEKRKDLIQSGLRGA